jgi:hypothetical protein
MEDNLNILVNGTQPQFIGEMEDNLNIIVIGRQPQYFSNWKTTPIF